MSTTSTIDTSALVAAGFEGEIIRPGDASYEDASKRWSKLIERKAGLVVHPANTSDVAKAVKFAVGGDQQVVIKGGGHGGAASSSSEGGVVIDLSVHLNDVQIDKERRTMTVGGGTRWGAIDAAAQKHGLAVVGPTHNDVGVGGFVLGGGYGGLTGKMGLACDNLLGGTLVTAKGDIVDVNEETEPELLWGLRGAGCNFGALTSITLSLVPEPEKVFGGSLFYPPPKFGAVWAAANAFRQDGMQPEDAMGIVLTQGPKGPVTVLSLAHHGPDADEAKSRFAPFFKLGPIIDATGMYTNAELNDKTTALNPPGRYAYSLSATHDRTPTDVAEAVHQEMLELWKEPAFAKSSMVINFWNPGQVMDPDKSAKSCFGGRGVWGNVLEVIVWEEKDHSAARAEEAGAVARKLREMWQMKSDAVAYGNPDSDQGVGDQRTKVLFSNNYERLQRLKKKWDPEQVWGSWFPITPADA